MTRLSKFLTLLFVSNFLFAAESRSQTAAEKPTQINFGYSRNPKTKSRPAADETVGQPAAAIVAVGAESAAEPEIKNANNDAKLVSANKTDEPPFESFSSASKTLEIAARAPARAASPTEIYKIGCGDVLFIGLQNAPSKASTYYTVLNDGTIDYPLAGEMVAVAGLTAEEIERLLAEKVKLYENPQISVKVREHASHSITVLGLVEKTGAMFLQREAVPLYVVRANAVVQPKSNRLIIKRADATTETIDLTDAGNDGVLIFSGDILDFKSTEQTAENAGAPLFYYIGGEIASAGQKDFHPGLTLTQAILASGGLRKAYAKKVVVRRKNEQGLLSPIEFDLRAIKDGKQPDPILLAGDTVEIPKN